MHRSLSGVTPSKYFWFSLNAAIIDPVLQKVQTEKVSGGRPGRDDGDPHSKAKGSAESREHRDEPESSSLKEEMKRERMLITVSQDLVAKPKPAVDQVKVVPVGIKGSRKVEDDEEDDTEGKSSREYGKKSEAKSSKSEKKASSKKNKTHKAKKKKSKKKKDKRKC